MTLSEFQSPAVRVSVRSLCLIAVLSALAGCGGTPLPPVPAEPSFFLETVPPEVVMMADPYQDLQAVRLKPEDNCYWYQHEGPVEATLLPLRTREGRPICLQRAANV